MQTELLGPTHVAIDGKPTPRPPPCGLRSTFSLVSPNDGVHPRRGVEPPEPPARRHGIWQGIVSIDVVEWFRSARVAAREWTNLARCLPGPYRRSCWPSAHTRAEELVGRGAIRSTPSNTAEAIDHRSGNSIGTHCPGGGFSQCVCRAPGRFSSNSSIDTVLACDSGFEGEYLCTFPPARSARDGLKNTQKSIQVSFPSKSCSLHW